MNTFSALKSAARQGRGPRVHGSLSPSFRSFRSAY